MKQTIIGTAVVVACCIAAPFAQQRPATLQQTPAHKVFELTGCLMAETAAAPTFKLTDAFSIGQGAAAGIPGAVGTSGRETATYELRPVSGVGEQGLNAEALKAHLGHRVEVVVRPMEPPAPPPATGLAVAQAAKPVGPRVERFTVTELKRVVGRCS